MDTLKRMYVAGGCFWGMEALVRTVPGVISTTTGYTGGENDAPTYEYHPGHAEAPDAESVNWSRTTHLFAKLSA